MLFTAVLIGVFGFGAIFGYALNTVNLRVHKDPSVNANVFFAIDNAGVHEEFSSGNVITNIGENNVRNWLGFTNQTSSTNTTSVISLGNGTIAQTLTKLAEATTANFSRVNGTIAAWMNGTDYAFNVTYTFTASATISVNATGLHWDESSDSDNNMFACAYLTDGTQHQFTATSTCTVTWVITVDAN